MKKNIWIISAVFVCFMFGKITTTASQNEKNYIVSTEKSEEVVIIEPTEKEESRQEPKQEQKRKSEDEDKSISANLLQTDIEPKKALETEESHESMEADSGLLYYLNLYLYQNKISYLKAYKEYVEKTLEISENMFEMGEMTAHMVKSYEVQLAEAEAELIEAKNEETYYSLYLQEEELDYSNYTIEEIKTVNEEAYYKEKYPNANYMDIVRYLTDFQNATAYIEAKKAQKDYALEKFEISTVLFEEGEIAGIELLEAEVEVKKVQYELAEYYVQMNTAYWKLKNLE